MMISFVRPTIDEVAVVVEHARVAGVQPPSSVKIARSRSGSSKRPTQTFGPRTITSPSRHVELDLGQGLAVGVHALLERRAGAVPGHDQGFGEPVDPQHVDPRLGAGPHDLGRYRCATAPEAGERRQVATARSRPRRSRSVRKVVAASVYEQRSRSTSSAARSGSHAVLQHELHPEVQRQSHAEVEPGGVADGARRPHDVVGPSSFTA